MAQLDAIRLSATEVATLYSALQQLKTKGFLHEFDADDVREALRPGTLHASALSSYVEILEPKCRAAKIPFQLPWLAKLEPVLVVWELERLDTAITHPAIYSPMTGNRYQGPVQVSGALISGFLGHDLEVQADGVERVTVGAMQVLGYSDRP